MDSSGRLLFVFVEPLAKLGVLPQRLYREPLKLKDSLFDAKEHGVDCSPITLQRGVLQLH